MTDSLESEAHKLFIKRCLTALPHYYTAEATNHLALINFILSAQTLLREKVPAGIAPSLSDHFVPATSTFSSHTYHPNDTHIPSTFFALCSLYLEHAPASETLSFLNPAATIREIGRLQVTESGDAGSFRSHRDGLYDADMRQLYMAMAVVWLCVREGLSRTMPREHLCRMLRCSGPDGISLALARSFVTRSLNKREHAYGGKRGGEAHAGHTFCALATLVLLNDLESFATGKAGTLCPGRLDSNRYERTIRWLVLRQVGCDSARTVMDDCLAVWDWGGCAGRANKRADACYGFWVTAALSLISLPNGAPATTLLDEKALQDFLLRCQTRVAGFAPGPSIAPLTAEATLCQGELAVEFATAANRMPDVYHTYLALSALEKIAKGNEVRQTHDYQAHGIAELALCLVQPS
ncbi:hypothetical protein PYCC9005_002127 [Savitreella phatthalungensis]